ncbi:alpha amylase C-terminal domain-containing protein [Yinghuangia aomiensis]
MSGGEVLNSDAAVYGGSDVRNPQDIVAEQETGLATITPVPPLATVWLKPR